MVTGGGARTSAPSWCPLSVRTGLLRQLADTLEGERGVPWRAPGLCQACPANPAQLLLPPRARGGALASPSPLTLMNTLCPCAHRFVVMEEKLVGSALDRIMVKAL